MQKRWFALSLIVLALVLAACGGGETSEQGSGEEELAVEIQDLYFGQSDDNVENPPVWRVSSGSEIALHLDNTGALEHTWSVLKAGEEIVTSFVEGEDEGKILFTAGVVAPGADKEVSFTAPEPGEYSVICTIPGHASLMQGRLVVEG